MTPESRFTRSTAVRLSRQCLEVPDQRETKQLSYILHQLKFQAIHDLHRTGILHRDIKASNFAWSAERKVYLLDLGFCRRFVGFLMISGIVISRQRFIFRKLQLALNEQEVRHRAPRKQVAFLGTSKYCSPNMHKKLDQGRRDDLWAWLYMTVEFMAGKLIWRNDEDKVIEKKKERIGSKLLLKCPQEMYMIYDHIRHLEFKSKPNYAMLRRQLDRGDWQTGSNSATVFCDVRNCAMTSRSVLRPRQTSTAAVVSHTPSKESSSRYSSGRRSLPRNAKVVAQMDDCEDLFNSPEKRHGKTKGAVAATPATKISQHMAAVLTIESPETQKENSRSSSRAGLRSAAAHRRLDLGSQSAKVTRRGKNFDGFEVEHDENIPPVGDCVGRRLPRKTVQAFTQNVVTVKSSGLVCHSTIAQ
ncbi:hypothetical protein ANCCEY_08620 [Ancylostoma ceylanicum]|uniref:Protein kinase domain-containing protein n=1 Tax=Ancylostoma ceylanicum TaxID=53326 RepID=A0A0D6LQI2_9BILA|nr:hypothetical protein ANCCEY_08620 [Ancylostoma ceylanicum]